jgi:hypothetical protein
VHFSMCLHLNDSSNHEEKGATFGERERAQ